MLRAIVAGGAAGALLVLGTAVAQEHEASSVRDAKRAVEAHKRRLEKDIGDLKGILGAQAMLARYFELGGEGEGEILDPALCHGSALRALCASLEATFGENDG